MTSTFHVCINNGNAAELEFLEDGEHCRDGIEFASKVAAGNLWTDQLALSVYDNESVEQCMCAISPQALSGKSIPLSRTQMNELFRDLEKRGESTSAIRSCLLDWARTISATPGISPSNHKWYYKAIA